MSSPEDVPGYFKSSFARSMACSSESKSLEPVVICEPERDAVTPVSEKPQVIVKPSPRRSVPAIPTYDTIRESLRRTRNDPVKFWKMKQETNGDTNGWISPSANSSQSSDEEILRLRKECQGLIECNRKLQQSGTSMEINLLQSQVDTLQWQLKQAESSRQMHRAVMEQVSKFLERVHKSFETGTKVQNSRAKHRVPRSRSVHTVANGGHHSRASSPSPSTASSIVHRANSISQIQDSYSTWRSSRMTVVEENIAPEKLSQEAFRLLRTIQSLLNTREPDLARLSDQEHSSSDNRDSTSMGSCSSLVLHGSNGSRAEESKASCSPATPQLSVGSAEDESGFSSMSSFHEPHPPSDYQSAIVRQTGSNGSVDHHHLSLRRASYQSTTTSVSDNHPDKPRFVETIQVVEPSCRVSQCGGGSKESQGFPPMTNPRSFHELGLPLVDASPLRHRRWSSTPVDHPHQPSDSLRVLWV